MHSSTIVSPIIKLTKYSWWPCVTVPQSHGSNFWNAGKMQAIKIIHTGITVVNTDIRKFHLIWTLVIKLDSFYSLSYYQTFSDKGQSKLDISKINGTALNHSGSTVQACITVVPLNLVHFVSTVVGNKFSTVVSGS